MRKRKVSLVALILGLGVLALACGDININNSNQAQNNAAGSGPNGPSGGGVIVNEVKLGCFGMVGPGDVQLSDCPANLGEYIAHVGTKGTLDATPVDETGNKVPNQNVNGWTNTNSAVCKITGQQTGPDGFNPQIELVASGSCDIGVEVGLKTGGPRRFTAIP